MKKDPLKSQSVKSQSAPTKSDQSNTTSAQKDTAAVKSEAPNDGANGGNAVSTKKCRLSGIVILFMVIATGALGWLIYSTLVMHEVVLSLSSRLNIIENSLNKPTHQSEMTEIVRSELSQIKDFLVAQSKTSHLAQQGISERLQKISEVSERAHTVSADAIQSALKEHSENNDEKLKSLKVQSAYWSAVMLALAQDQPFQLDAERCHADLTPQLCERLAAAAVPAGISCATLAHEFKDLVPRLLTHKISASGENVSGVKAFFSQLISVRRVGENVDPVSIDGLINAIEVGLKEHVLDKVMTAYSQLPGAAQEEAREWYQHVEQLAQREQLVKEVSATTATATPTQVMSPNVVSSKEGA